MATIEVLNVPTIRLELTRDEAEAIRSLVGGLSKTETTDALKSTDDSEKAYTHIINVYSLLCETL